MEVSKGRKQRTCDVAVVGAGAAGFSAAIAAAEAGSIVTLFNTHPQVGLKILMSGGTRCNVTHDHVEPTAFHGSSRNAVAIVLKAFSARQTREWFRDLGVELKLEPGGKLFPITDSASTVLDALVARATALNVRVAAGVRVDGVQRSDGKLLLDTSDGGESATAVVLTTGGLSYPKTGSDGTGHEIARSLGHSIVELTPALTPLVLAGDLHSKLQGVTLPAALTLQVSGRPVVTCAGSLLFTHFGITGPAALDMSRHWLRVPPHMERTLRAHFTPGAARSLAEGGGLLEPERAEKSGGLPDRAWLEREWLDPARGRATIQSHFGARLPVRLVREIASRASVDHAALLSAVNREARKRFLDLLTAFPLEVTGTLGYRKAEVTAGGVPLSEVDPRRMASRVVPGLYFAGEILDVDGRLGGYNFQWAWSSGRVAGRAAADWAGDGERRRNAAEAG